MVRRLLLFVVAVCGLARAELTRFEIARRVDLPDAGYEKLVGTAHFAVDPKAPANQGIADLDTAVANTHGQVEFTADLSVIRPKDARTSNGAAFVEVVNRGRPAVFLNFHRRAARDPSSDAELGDAFLTRQGFTIAWVGWEFDAPAATSTVRIHVPTAGTPSRPVTATIRARFTVDAPAKSAAIAELADYPALADRPRLELVRRSHPADATGTTLPADGLALEGQKLTYPSGFEPGYTYELSYRSANPPLAGLGFAAIRDTVAWLKHDADTPVRWAYGFGTSQCGRFLRSFVYEGFNTDEKGRGVFDGVIAHIAGASRLDLNRPGATPRTVAFYTATAYPFADTALADPVTGSREGLLENARVKHPPRIFYTNTSVEYWGGARAAALVHTDPAGTRDVAPPANVRFYFVAGTQHGPERFPPAAAPAPRYWSGNPVDYWPVLRALVPAMHGWVSAEREPPPSVYPKLADGTLVRAADVRFPVLPGGAVPNAIRGGARCENTLLPQQGGVGAPLPLLVPAVDADGNEQAGIRLPDIAVPLATATGWSLRRNPAAANSDLIALAGSWVPFARTPAERERAHDPRPSIAERYPSRTAYLEACGVVANRLVAQGYVVSADVPVLLKRAGDTWDLLTSAPAR